MLSEKSIENGLRRHEFVLHYQPKISLLTGKVVGAEALVRWEYPGRLTVPPSEFIPVAEQSSLINRMTAYIVSALADQIRCAGRRVTIPLSFNASARDFEDPSVVNHILGTVTREGIDPRMLEIEITESHALAEGTQVIENMARLGEAGIALTMDDYGTGYSIPDSLSKWPFTTIKLDQGIIGRMLSSEKNATIVRSSIRLAHELDLKVIAEGIETSDQYQFLLESGCYLGQGFLISRPLPFAAFIDFADRQAAKPGSPVGLINMAMLDHIEWRKAIVSYALKRAAMPPASIERREYDHADLSPTRVSFGKWHTCRGRKPSSYAFFCALHLHQRRLYRVGARIVKQIRAGAQSVEINNTITDLNACSANLLDVLASLEDLGLSDMYKPVKCASLPAAIAQCAASKPGIRRLSYVSDRYQPG